MDTTHAVGGLCDPPTRRSDRGQEASHGRVRPEMAVASCDTRRDELGGAAAEKALANLARVAGPDAPDLVASLRLPEMDLVVRSGAGIALYTLRWGSEALSWEQRVLAFPAEAELQLVYDSADWARRARESCFSTGARACRVSAGVVAAEARILEQHGVLPAGEASVYALSLGAASTQIAHAGSRSKPGRKMIADVKAARCPSHVPLLPLQRALAEEMALGRSLQAICSRSEHFDPERYGSATNQFCRALGLLWTRDSTKRKRFARVAPSSLAEKLCEALDLCPQEVGL